MKESKCTAPRPTRRPSHLRRPDDEQIMRALDLSCRQDFLTFASACFELVTGEPLPRLFYIEAIAFELDQIRRGKNRRQIFNLPPGFFKSFLVSVCWPAYLLGLDPRIRVMVASSTLDLAVELSNALSPHLRFRPLQARFPRNANFAHEEYRIRGRHHYGRIPARDLDGRSARPQSRYSYLR